MSKLSTLLFFFAPAESIKRAEEEKRGLWKALVLGRPGLLEESRKDNGRDEEGVKEEVRGRRDIQRERA